MAKMNKAETERAARDHAVANPAIKALTAAQLQELDYTARKDLATVQASGAYRHLDIYVTSRYPDAFEPAYVDSAMSVFSQTIKTAEVAVRNWKLACQGIEPQQAEAKIVELVTSMNIRGASIGNGQVAVHRGGDSWSGYGATLYWRIARDWDSKHVNPNNPAQAVHEYSIHCEVSTSGSTYDLATMAVIHKVHGELLDAANEIMAVANKWKVVSKWGEWPEPTEA